MKKLITIILLLCMISSGESVVFQNSSATETYFKVEVVQNGKVIQERNGLVQLEKKPFKFKLTFTKTKDVFVSSSWGTYYYDYPSENNIFECKDHRTFNDCRFVSVKTANEDKFNVDKDISVGDGGYQNVWFYDEEIDWYRMDKGVIVKNGVIHSEVTVENIYDMDKRDEGKYEQTEYNYPIEKINQDVYMVFATDQYEKGMEHPKELQREKFILKFK